MSVSDDPARKFYWPCSQSLRRNHEGKNLCRSPLSLTVGRFQSGLLRRQSVFYHCDGIISVYRSGGFSWLRPKDTVSDWWRVARLYGARKGVDRFFRVNYPAAFAGDHWFFNFGRRVARRVFPKKRPAWFNSAAMLFMSLDAVIMSFDGRKSKSKSAHNRCREMRHHDSSGDRSANPPADPPAR